MHVLADFRIKVYVRPQNLSIVLSKFWHLVCMSCKPDIFKLGACTLRINAIMNLIPHDIDAQKNISIVDFEHTSKGEIFSVHPFLILCIMQNEVLQE